jgi:DNA-binding GntR family transcriptional regulator
MVCVNPNRRCTMARPATRLTVIARDGAPPRPAARPAARPTARTAAQPAADSTRQIVDSVTAAIVERRLMPGTKLSEQKLADIFGVSRTLIRQALNQLSRDRLVTLERARGAFVATPSIEEAHEVFAVRQMLESAMVRQLSARITPAQVAELRAHLAAEQQAVARTDVSGRTRLLADFHVVLARMLGNQVLAQLLADLLARSALVSLMVQSSHAAACSQGEHVAIVDALAAHDGETAARLICRHLDQVEQHLRTDPRHPDLAQILKPYA